MARVKAVLRRLRSSSPRDGRESTRRVAGNLSLDETDGTVSVADQFVALTRKEFDILCLLIEHPGPLFSRAHLLEVPSGYASTRATRTVDTHIRRLRAKLDHAGWQGGAIGTVWGKGYRLERKED